MPVDDETTDEELMLSLAQGNDQAFHQLFERWKRPLISYFYRSLNDYHKAEDLALQVASKVYSARHNYRILSKFSTWMFQIAQNLLRDEFRKMQTSKSRMFVPEFDYGDEAMGEDHQSVAEMEEWLMHTIRDMKEQERSLILLVYQQGFTPSEAAEVLGIKPNYARVLLHKIRSYLTEEFKTS
jgi:RNA polymerase sigma-70 factor (ECF subfamily)